MGQKEGSVGIIPCANDKREVIAAIIIVTPGLKHVCTMNNDGIGWNMTWENVGGSKIGDRIGLFDTRVVFGESQLRNSKVVWDGTICFPLKLFNNGR